MIYPSIIRDEKARAGSPSKMSLFDQYSNASDDQKFGISRNALEWWSVYGFGGIPIPGTPGAREGDEFLDRKILLHDRRADNYYAMAWLEDTSGSNFANFVGLRSLFTAVISGGMINLVPSDHDLQKDQTYQNAMIFFTGLALSIGAADMKERSKNLEARVRVSLKGRSENDYGEQRKVYDGALDRIEEEFSKSTKIGDIKGQLTRLQSIGAPTPTPTPTATGDVEDLRRRIEELEATKQSLERLLASQLKSTNDRIGRMKKILRENLGNMDTKKFADLVNIKMTKRLKLFDLIPETQ